MVLYREFRPDRRLLPFVECSWIRSGPANVPVRVLPDGCMDLFVTGGGDVTVAGPARAFYELLPSKDSVLAGLRLRPGAAVAVTGRPASEFSDIRVPIDSVFGITGYRLTENLLDTTTPEQRIILLQNRVAGYFAAVEPSVDRPVAWAVRALRAKPDLPVSALAADVGLSERQLRRRFEAAVGYGPKRLGRIFRFQRLLDLIHTTADQARWADIALAAGYSDQSHMINECVPLAGVPPTALPSGKSVSSNTAEGLSP